MLAKRSNIRVILIALNTIFLWTFLYLQPRLKKDDEPPPPAPKPAPVLRSGQGIRVGRSDQKCSDLKGLEDIIVLLKTGANEAEARLAVQLSTLFPCVQHGLIFSDVEQSFQGHHVYDPLHGFITNYMKEDDPDMRYYKHIQEAFANGTASSIGREDGWKLDRFKYMPLIQKAYSMYPDAKWFVNVETDTAVVWSNLITWLSHMDHRKPIYMGSEVVGAKAPNENKFIIFAHGGSGFLVSQTAAAMLSDGMMANERKFFEFAKGDPCGDSALSKGFWEVGIKAHRGYPHSNGEPPERTIFNSQWCLPPVFFHHVDNNVINEIHDLDERISTNKTVTMADIFDKYVREHVKAEIPDWDNGYTEMVTKAGDKEEAAQSFEKCKEACIEDPTCIQFNYKHAECRLGDSIRRGESQTGRKSGYLMDRVEDFRERNQNCIPQWIVENPYYPTV